MVISLRFQGLALYCHYPGHGSYSKRPSSDHQVSYPSGVHPQSSRVITNICNFKFAPQFSGVVIHRIMDTTESWLQFETKDEFEGRKLTKDCDNKL